MNAAEGASKDHQFLYLLTCPCGVRIEAGSEDEIVNESLAHLRDSHPDRADSYEREHILLMAVRLRS